MLFLALKVGMFEITPSQIPTIWRILAETLVDPWTCSGTQPRLWGSRETKDQKCQNALINIE